MLHANPLRHECRNFMASISRGAGCRHCISEPRPSTTQIETTQQKGESDTEVSYAKPAKISVQCSHIFNHKVSQRLNRFEAR